MVDTVLNAAEVLTHFILRRHCQLRPWHRQEAVGECDDNSHSSEKPFQGSPPCGSSEHASPRPFRTAPRGPDAPDQSKPWWSHVRPPDGPTPPQMPFLCQKCPSLHDRPRLCPPRQRYFFQNCPQTALPLRPPQASQAPWGSLRILHASLFALPSSSNICSVWLCAPSPHLWTPRGSDHILPCVPTDQHSAQHRLRGPVWTHELRGSVPHLHISVFICELPPRAPEW